MDSDASDGRTPSGETLAATRDHLTRTRTIPGVAFLERLVVHFSPAERLALYIFGALIIASTLIMLGTLNGDAMVREPVSGGTLTEGVVGTPRFVNPLLATSDADRDVAALVYSGLMRVRPDGSFVNDLAADYEISEDGTVYTFVIRDDAVFHNGTPVTAADVLFTVQAAQDAMINSARRTDWEGVEVVQLNEHTVQFTLPRPYAPFLENTTLGILPKHLWENVAPADFPFHQLNTNPVGSGPFEIDGIRTDSTGAPTQYTLRAFDEFVLGKPHLSRIVMRFYPNEDTLIGAYERGDIRSMAGITSSRASRISTEKSLVLTATLPRVFAVFFNQNQAAVFADRSVRRALDTALDRAVLINEVLGGYGTPLSGPVPASLLSDTTASAGDTRTQDERIQEAQDILDRNGWDFDEELGVWVDGDENELSFSISTVNTPELAGTAEYVANVWRLVGVDVTVEMYTSGEINTNIIRPRSYDALLFGEIVGRSLDLFAFWHSSQRNDPGLNLALYTNATADSLLSDAREETNRVAREELYLQFADEIATDIPAAFLYAPEFVYFTPENVQGISLGALATPSERFLNVHEWYLDAENVWTIFSNVTN